MKRLIYSIVAFAFSFHVYAVTPTIVGLQYWFNTDLEYEYIEPVIADSINVITQTIDASHLPYGFHHLYFRVKDDMGRWSSVASSIFYKQSYPKNDTISPVLCEYWIDDSPISSTKMNGNELSFTIDANPLAVGMHILNYRIQDNEGAYSSLRTWIFYKNSKAASKITWCKYWWNNHLDKAIIEEIVSDTSLIIFTKELTIPYYAKVDGYSANSTARLHFQFGDDLNHVSPMEWADISYPDNIAPTSVIEIDTTAEVPENEVSLKWYIINDQENDYNIYYAENDEPFVLWLANTTQKTAIFKMQEGVDYKFAVTARDQNGNVERLDEKKYIIVKSNSAK